MPKWPDWEDEDCNVDEDTLLSWLELFNMSKKKEEKGEVTYKCCRDESKDGSVQAFDRRMSSRVEVGVQGNALKNIEKPRDDGKDCVECHGPVDQIFEGFGSRKTEVEEEEGHFDDPVHPDVIYFFSKKSLELISM
jgi:hypothetical protein